MDRYQVIPRTMCFVFHEESVLMLKANSSKGWAGTYNPLGGHIEPGEDVLESGIREIMEESGVEAGNPKLRGVIHVSNFYGENILLFVITASTATTTTVSNHEGELKWVLLSDLDTLHTFEDVIPILKRIQQDDSFFRGRSVFAAGKLVELNLSMG